MAYNIQLEWRPNHAQSSPYFSLKTHFVRSESILQGIYECVNGANPIYLHNDHHMLVPIFHHITGLRTSIQT